MWYGAYTITLVVDKLQFLPEPRAATRAERLDCQQTVQIGCAKEIPHGNGYAALLANPENKSYLISLLCASFKQIFINDIYFHSAQHRLVFHIPDLDVVYCRQCYPEPTLNNQHGEADNTM